MRHAGRITLVIAMAILMTLAVGVPLATQGLADKDKVKLSLWEPEGGFEQLLDLGASGFSPGDSILLNTTLQDAKSKKNLGSTITDVRVIRTIGEDALFFVDCAVILKKGTFVFEGGGQFSKLGSGITFPIVGGTGAYEGANGTITIRHVAGGATFKASFLTD